MKKIFLLTVFAIGGLYANRRQVEDEAVAVMDFIIDKVESRLEVSYDETGAQPRRSAREIFQDFWNGSEGVRNQFGNNDWVQLWGANNNLLEFVEENYDAQGTQWAVQELILGSQIFDYVDPDKKEKLIKEICDVANELYDPNF